MVSLGCSPRVLLVDDDNDLNALLLAFLREEGYGCSLAASVEAALELARSAPFDVILTDLFRPVCQEMFQAILPLLRQAGPTPVGVMTGWNVTAEQVAEQGFAFLIAKPFDLDDLLAAIAASAQACPTRLRLKTPLEAAPRRPPARPVRWRGADDCQAG